MESELQLMSGRRSAQPDAVGDSAHERLAGCGAARSTAAALQARPREIEVVSGTRTVHNSGGSDCSV